MLLRIWTLVVAVLLVAAPPGAVAEVEVDVQAEHTADALVTQIAVPLAAPTPARVAIVACDEPMPPSPALSRVFRPPRSSFD